MIGRIVGLLAGPYVFVGVLGLLAGYNWYKYNECKIEFADYRAAVARDTAKANENTVKIVQALTKKYEAALKAKAVVQRATEREYREAVNAIHSEGKKNEAYRTWAEQPLPAGVVKRLRELPETRSGNQGR